MTIPPPALSNSAVLVRRCCPPRRRRRPRHHLLAVLTIPILLLLLLLVSSSSPCFFVRGTDASVPREQSISSNGRQEELQGDQSWMQMRSNQAKDEEAGNDDDNDDETNRNKGRTKQQQQQQQKHDGHDDGDGDDDRRGADDDSAAAAGTTGGGGYIIGTGSYDMTGPAAQVNFMGYAVPKQNGHGIHMRLRARAYIVSESIVQDDDHHHDQRRRRPSSQGDKTDDDGEQGEVEELPMWVFDEEEDEDGDEGDPQYTRLRRAGRTTASGRIGRMEEGGVADHPNDVIDDEQASNSSSSPPSSSSSSSSPYRVHQQLDPGKTICFVSIDAGMGSDLLTMKVVKRLEELLPSYNTTTTTMTTTTTQQGGADDEEGGDEENGMKKVVEQKTLCHLENLSISGTHTHSSPGGFLQYTLYQMTSLGYSKETMDTYVEGVALSLVRAYTNMRPGRIGTSSGLLHGANINRSPSSYLLNPQRERETYVDEGGDTDKRMLLLRFTGEAGRTHSTLSSASSLDDDGGASSSEMHHDKTTTINEAEGGEEAELGVLTWFSVHGTSMNSTNRLISGDNKGYASYLMERQFNIGSNASIGNSSNNNGIRRTFVAAFASTNLGDVSPNTNGPKCTDTGLPCDVVTSTCHGKNELCIASGPGKDMFESTEIIGRKQYEFALALYHNATNPLVGEIGFRHSFVDMSKRQVTLPGGQKVSTCPAALGYSFAAGTTDGPGAMDFRQNTTTTNPFWNAVRGFISTPTKEQRHCQHPKPILLNTGEATLPYRWDPASVPVSVFRVGQLLILNVPAEFTTMAGRRLRRAVAEVAKAHMHMEPIVTIAGLTNSYTHYVTTYEEYQAQRYEAASTLYGPHTLSAYIAEFERLTTDLFTDRPSTSDAPPGDLSEHQLSFIPPVEMDLVRPGKKFGSVSKDVVKKEHYTVGDVVEVTFRSANPRNNQRIESTFLTVDLCQGGTTIEAGDCDDAVSSSSWSTKYNDGDWSTKFIWEDGHYTGFSHALISWDIPQDVQPGTYRICHYGTSKRPLHFMSWLTDHIPTWLNWNGIGLQDLVLYSISRVFATRYADALWTAWNGSLQAKFHDFDGCSSSFAVKAE